MTTYSPSKITKDGNTYNFTDDTKIPLAGTSALSGSIIPSTDNSYDLGSSSYKLRYVYANTAYVTNLNVNAINGINPGALSLQGTSLINVSSSITSLDGETANRFTPQVSGWLLINGTGPADEGFIYVKQGRIGMISVTNLATLRCATLIPVVAGVEVTVNCKLGSLTWANIAPCQGNI